MGRKVIVTGEDGESDKPEEVKSGPIGRRSARLRLRAAWMYHVEGLTQTAIAEQLGIGRVTVVRMLADARALNEVKISLRHDLAELPALESALEKHFGISQAIVAPLSSADADPTPSIGAASGRFISEMVRPNMKLGVGWGRTLLSTLDFIDEAQIPDLAVVSLLGGVSVVHQYNPAEFAWRFSRLFQADCYLIAAPALVDSVETKRALVERCGIGPVFGMAESLDAVILSVGSTGPGATSFQFDYFTETDRLSLIERGAVGDVLYNFFDAKGKVVDHPLNDRVMSITVDQMRQTPMRILLSGGQEKTMSLIGALRLLEPTVFVTDEFSARAILAADR